MKDKIQELLGADWKWKAPHYFGVSAINHKGMEFIQILYFEENADEKACMITFRPDYKNSLTVQLRHRLDTLAYNTPHSACKKMCEKKIKELLEMESNVPS